MVRLINLLQLYFKLTKYHIFIYKKLYKQVSLPFVLSHFSWKGKDGVSFMPIWLAISKSGVECSIGRNNTYQITSH